MKKRVLSLFLAAALCFSTLPMTAFAQEADVTAENFMEDPAADGDVSGGNAAVRDAEKDAAVKAVQALIDALPEEVTAENAEDIGAQLAAIDEALENLAALDETLAGALNMERYNAICEALTTFVEAQDDAVHTDHPVCGAVCEHSGEDSHEAVEWIGISDVRDIKKDGNYYLEKDISYNSGYWYSDYDINLCLNGHKLEIPDYINIGYSTAKKFSLCNCDPNQKGTCSGITVYLGSKFSLYDNVQIIKKSNTPVRIEDGSKFIMYGGTICDSESGVEVYNNSTFEMKGGEICNNTAYLNTSGGVEIGKQSEFIMTGGSIHDNNMDSRNSTGVGGGVYIRNGSFTMTGGSITGNHSNTNGGGVYVGSRFSNSGEFGSFTMTGGEITGNTADEKGAGVYVGNNTSAQETNKITVSGNVKIADNENSNVYLPDGVSIAIGTDGLGNAASIGVSAETTEGKNTIIANGADHGYVDGCIFSDNTNKVIRMGDEILLNIYDLQFHPVCGKNCEDGENHDSLTWIGISALDQITEDGNYYLTQPVKLRDVWTCNYNVKLCLNGNTITGWNGASVIEVAKGMTLDITDCQKEAGKITHNTGENGYGIMVSGILNLWNGIITGNRGTASGYSGCGVYVKTNGIFYMNGGIITGNTSKDAGGGVYMSRTATFHMNGGSITGNNTASTIGGGGVYVWQEATFTVSGTAQIKDNWKNGTLQGDVYVKGENGTADNVYLPGSSYSSEYFATITIGEGLTEDAWIGVSKNSDELGKGQALKIAVGATNTQIDYDKIFTPDATDQNYEITWDSNGNLFLGLHQHDWNYALKTGTTDTIVAACGCGEDGGSVTIKTPAAGTLTYDGREKQATLENTLSTGVKVPNIEYKKGTGSTSELPAGSLPTSAGDYTASITLTGADGKSATASVKYTIQKAELAESDFTFTAPGSLVYNGSHKKAYFYSRKVNTQLITAKYYDESGAEVTPRNVGTYIVRINVRESTNYNAVNGLTANSWKFTITKAQGGSLTAYNFGQKFSNLTERSCTPDYSGLPAGQNWKYSISNATASGSASVASYNIDPATGKLTYKLADGEIGDTVRWTVTISSNNYTDFTQELILTLSDKEDQEPLIIVGDSTVVYGQTLKLTTTGGSGTGAVTYWVDPNLGTGTATIDAEGVLTPGKVGTVAVRAFKAGDDDYNAAVSARLAVTITKAMPTGEPGYTEITSDGKTLADAGLTLTNSTLTPGDGTLEWIDDEGNALKADTRVEVNKTYRWRFTPVDANYDTLTGGIKLYHVDAPAISTQPKDVAIQPGEKAVFEVKAAGTDLKYQWMIDRNDGKGFVAITGADGASYSSGVTDLNCNGYRYYCVISNIIGSVTTNTVTLTVSNNTDPKPTATPKPTTTPKPATDSDSDPYRIIDGANSSWTQNTDGTLSIRGNGEFAKFVNVKVDGQIVDPGNYTATEGSTIITLKTEYLKTLSEGSHAFEIVWTDGTASTSFTVAANTSGDDDDDDGDSNNNADNSNNTSSNSNTVPAQVTAPKTGDASGYWILLFAISCAGLVGMLVRRKR